MALPLALGAALRPLTESTWTLAALSAATESGLVTALARPGTLEALCARTTIPMPSLRGLLDVLLACGLARREDATFVAEPDLAVLASDDEAFVVWRDELRRALGQPRALAEDARHGNLGKAWHHLDDAVIEAQGTFARVHTRVLMLEGIVPELEGLTARLSREGARVLDVGAGAAGNAIAFAEAWPLARIVGLEPWGPSRALGLGNVARSRFAHRIEIRPERIEDLAERDAYDVIWLPQMFLDDATWTRALESARDALRPGGWLLTAWICDPDRVDLAGALARVRDLAFGGAARGPRDLLGQLGASGLRALHAKPFGDGALGMIAGRRGDP